MKFPVRRIAGNFLFAADVFILFLVLFESKMVLPGWLQSVGRMHPMILHFPIVILLLAMGMEFFRFNPHYRSQDFYQAAATNLLLTGALFASVTVIMGLLLSKEGGYSGSNVGWHKWTGTGIAVLASLLYWSRDANWYKAPVARIGAVVTTVCLIMAGHFGAGITHGDDFISTPMLSKAAAPKVSADKAIIYTDLVQPVLAAKCMSCHNSTKAKGELILDNPDDINKGGKSGKLFTAFNADSSLMMQRIHLPEEEKKHMPLEGKPQLTAAEKELLYRWIQSGADFKKKFNELPENDSLRLVAATFLAPAQEEEYDFASADEKTIHALSNNYRVVFPVAKESPALVVDFYNKKEYSSKSLEELLPLKMQLVELNLEKMPVKDEDLKTISQFQNLRSLNLGFTEITGKGLFHLSSLKNLRSLSLSGNALNIKDISALTTIKKIAELFIWNTGLTKEDIAALQKANSKIKFVEGYRNDGPPMPLNTPILVTTNRVFKDTIHLMLKHPIPGAQIRYTLDGSRPDSVYASLFDKDLIIDRTTIFKARAFKETWLGSDSIMYNFYKSAYSPDSIDFISFPAESFKGDGAKTLIDHITGDMGFGSGKWLGFQKDMEMSLRFNKPVKLASVAINMLTNIGADIYPPVVVEVWGGKDKTHMKLLQTLKPKQAVKGDVPSIVLEKCSFTGTTINCLKLVAVSVKKVPKWGNTPGKPGWVFADEILLN